MTVHLNFRTIAFFLGVLIFSSSNLIASDALANAGFQKWIRDFEKTARKSGISKSTYRLAFKGVTSPDPRVLEKARFQPEFIQKTWHYLDTRVNERTIGNGKEMKRKWSRLLSRIEKSYGIDRHIILAIWSMETSYGAALEKPGRLHNVIRALATIAYADKRRRKFGRTQLIHAMRILQNGHVSREGLIGSWAGAMGHTQFIPSSYNTYAVDADGNGRKDIWNSIPDALATAANLLKRNGWRTGRTWGYEVKLPKSVTSKQNGKTRTLGQWQKLGVRRINGKPFPRPKEKAVLKLMSGRNGPAFLMLRNFYVLKRYNNADKYALGVGHLADRIAGYGPIQKKWPRKFQPLSDKEKKELQRLLSRLGLYDGEIDGDIGSGSRAAIKQMQKKFGMRPDGYDSKEFLRKLRRYRA
ncbi:MAG: lytic murein transglycosylase [Pseudomonadota bacterium]